MGTNVIILTVVTMILILLFVTWFLINQYRDNWFTRQHHKLTSGIFWNFWLRLFMESCLELTIADGIYLIARKELLT